MYSLNSIRQAILDSEYHRYLTLIKMWGMHYYAQPIQKGNRVCHH